jgi:hypothetical protein
MAPLDDSNPKFKKVLDARERTDIAAELDVENGPTDQTPPAPQDDLVEGQDLDDGSFDEPGFGGRADREAPLAESVDGGRGTVPSADEVGAVTGTAEDGIGVRDSSPVTPDEVAAEPGDDLSADGSPEVPSPREVGMAPLNEAGTPHTVAPITADAVDEDPTTPPTVTPAMPVEVYEFEGGEQPEEETIPVDDDPMTPPTVTDPTLGQDGNPTLATTTGDDEDGPSAQTPTIARLDKPEKGRSKEKWFEFAKSVDLSEGRPFRYEDHYEDVTKDTLVTEYGDR